MPDNRSTSDSYIGGYVGLEKDSGPLFGGTFSYPSDSRYGFPWRDEFFGSPLPSWRSIIRNGGNATTQARGIKTTVEKKYFSMGATYKVKDSWVSLGLPPGTIELSMAGFPSIPAPSFEGPDTSVDTKTYNRCLRKFYDACQAARSSIESGQDLGEYRETLRGLMNPLSSLRSHTLSYFDTLKKVRRRTRGSASLKKALADTYLEWTFGWNPLVSDIAKAYVALQNADRHFVSVPVETSASEDYGGFDSEHGIVASTGFLNVNCFVVRKSRHTIRMKGSMGTGAENGRIGLSQNLQLLPQDWVPTAWDLLPYSFIVDYFLNIGDIIRSYSFNWSGLRWGCMTRRSVTTTIYRFSPEYGESAFFDRHDSFLSADNATAVVKHFDRTIIHPDELVPRLEFHIPTGPKPWVNMAAILIARSTPLVPFFL